MSNSDNPYLPPSASLDGDGARVHGSGAEAGISDAAVRLLVQTRPWVKFLAVLAFVFIALMALAAVGTFFVKGPRATFALIPISIIMALYVLPAIYLWRYARSLARLQSGGGMAAVEAALASQKTFWKLCGIMAIVVIGMYIVAIIFSASLGALAARALGH